MAKGLPWIKFIDRTKDFLPEYFKNKGIEYPFSDNTSSEQILEYIKTLHKDSQRIIESDFLIISDFCSHKGSLDIHTEATNQNIILPQYNAEEELVMWLFLYHRKLLNELRVWDKVNISKNWEVENIDFSDNIQDIQKKEEELAIEIKKHFKKEENRIIKCDVESFIQEDRICFVAYPEGLPATISKYKEDTEEISHVTERPVSEFFFVIYPKKGKLWFKSNTHYKWERIRDVKKVFVEDILEKEFDDELENKQFALWQFLNRQFGTTLKEKAKAKGKVEFIKLQYISVKDRYQKKEMVALKAEGTDDPNEIYGMMNKHNVYAPNAFVQSVKIQVKFSGEGIIGNHTFSLGFPNYCSLGGSEEDQLCWEYIENWGIIKGTDLEANIWQFLKEKSSPYFDFWNMEGKLKKTFEILKRENMLIEDGEIDRVECWHCEDRKAEPVQRDEEGAYFTCSSVGTGKLRIHPEQMKRWRFDLEKFLQKLRELLKLKGIFEIKKEGEVYLLGILDGVDVFFIRDRGESADWQIYLQKEPSPIVLVPISDKDMLVENQVSIGGIVSFGIKKMQVDRKTLLQKAKFAYVPQGLFEKDEKIETLNLKKQIFYGSKSGKIVRGRSLLRQLGGHGNEIFAMTLSYSKNQNKRKISFEDLLTKVRQANGDQYGDGTMEKNISELKGILKESFEGEDVIIGGKAEGFAINPVFLDK
ncbi:hypothetical protein HZA38_03055 [Candidatus Peregrinibacteria bacterium]|nr:hypothetical protein [Candidatus Peregrinibacteria bacterium]